MIKTCVPGKTVFLSYLRVWNTKGVPPMKIGVVIHALSDLRKQGDSVYRETECTWVIKGGICDG